MKLTTHKRLCGNDACTSLILLLDDELLDGIHRAEVVAKLETAVNLHDEFVGALRDADALLAALIPVTPLAARRELAALLDKASRSCNTVFDKLSPVTVDSVTSDKWEV